MSGSGSLRISIFINIFLPCSSFVRAQEIFKDALSTNELRLCVVKTSLSVASQREEMSVDDKENRRDVANANSGNAAPNAAKTKPATRYFDASTSTTGKLGRFENYWVFDNFPNRLPILCV